jgi:mono/diheme cytochrome c family protein
MSITTMPRTLRILLGLVAVLALLAALVAWLNVRGEEPVAPGRSAAAVDADAMVRGAYLARAGNCLGCHTARGGAEYAGGRGIATPFGTVYAPNLTPDPETGLGAWSASEFRRALRHGRSRDGRLLYPAFPYPNYTLVTAEDADALYAFLQSLPPVRQPNRAHELRFPYNLQASLAVWRALFFRPQRHEPEAGRAADWNRGRYLVQGLGHCVACHGGRNWLGATSGGLELGGGQIPMLNWYAPSLAASREAGVGDWSSQDVVSLLETGLSPRGSAMGPMAEVVFGSTQHLSPQDLLAMATYLKTLPRSDEKAEPVAPANAEVMRVGGKIYEDRCAACHGDEGEGAAGKVPALAGNRAATMASPGNLVQAILLGGFPPATRGNPRPFGMPPFKQVLSEREVAQVATYVRQSWGNQAEAVSELDVLRAR